MLAATADVNLDRVRRNAADVAAAAGVPLLAVVKADAYGLGTAAVADALADLGDRLDGFYVFDAAEAVDADLFRRTGRRTVALHGASVDPDDYRSRHIQPVVWDTGRAAALRAAHPVVAIDTGQQRFACPPADAAAVRRAADAAEAMTHATRPGQAELFGATTDGWAPRPTRHAAGSALLDDPAARFDRVRPGLALYRGALRVSAPLIEVRDSVGPAGYTGFHVPRFGVVRVGYSDGLKPGPCRVNGRPQRVLEVGMQSAFVSLAPGDRAGDAVVLLGPDDPAGDPAGDDGLTEAAVAADWRTSPQEVLVRLAGAGRRVYRGGRSGQG